MLKMKIRRRMSRKNIRTMLSIFVLISTSNVTFSETRLINEGITKGWHGSVGAYVMAGTGKLSQQSPGTDSNKAIMSLNNEPNEEDFSTAFPTLTLGYGVSDDTQIALDIFQGSLTSNSLLEHQGLIDIRLQKKMRHDSVFWISLSPDFPGLYETWEDPYLTGQPRKKVEANANAASVGIDYLLGSPFSFSFLVGEQSVKNDRAGDSMRGRLSEQQIRLLTRDLRYWQGRMALTLSIARDVYIEGGFTYLEVDAEGEANSFSAKGMDLALAYIGNDIDAYLIAEVNRLDYDRENPIFNKSREEYDISVVAGMSYKSILRVNNISLDFLLSFSRRDSDINFYVEETATALIGMTYVF